MNIDFKLLKQQKESLLIVIDSLDPDSKLRNDLDGILYLIDGIQDEQEDGNENEQELKSFLEHCQAGDFQINLLLRGSGMATTFDNKKAINICEVNGHGNKYIFGGISEKFFDQMVERFDSRVIADGLLKRFKRTGGQ